MASIGHLFVAAVRWAGAVQDGQARYFSLHLARSLCRLPAFSSTPSPSCEPNLALAFLFASLRNLASAHLTLPLPVFALFLRAFLFARSYRRTHSTSSSTALNNSPETASSALPDGTTSGHFLASSGQATSTPGAFVGDGEEEEDETTGQTPEKGEKEDQGTRGKEAVAPRGNQSTTEAFLAKVAPVQAVAAVAVAGSQNEDVEETPEGNGAAAEEEEVAQQKKAEVRKAAKEVAESLSSVPPARGDTPEGSSKTSSAAASAPADGGASSLSSPPINSRSSTANPSSDPSPSLSLPSLPLPSLPSPDLPSPATSTSPTASHAPVTTASSSISPSGPLPPPFARNSVLPETVAGAQAPETPPQLPRQIGPASAATQRSPPALVATVTSAKVGVKDGQKRLGGLEQQQQEENFIVNSGAKQQQERGVGIRTDPSIPTEQLGETDKSRSQDEREEGEIVEGEGESALTGKLGGISGNGDEEVAVAADVQLSVEAGTSGGAHLSSGRLPPGTSAAPLDQDDPTLLLPPPPRPPPRQSSASTTLPSPALPASALRQAEIPPLSSTSFQRTSSRSPGRRRYERRHDEPDYWQERDERNARNKRGEGDYREHSWRPCEEPDLRQEELYSYPQRERRGRWQERSRWEDGRGRGDQRYYPDPAPYSSYAPYARTSSGAPPPPRYPSPCPPPLSTSASYYTPSRYPFPTPGPSAWPPSAAYNPPPPPSHFSTQPPPPPQPSHQPFSSPVAFSPGLPSGPSRLPPRPRPPPATTASSAALRPVPPPAPTPSALPAAHKKPRRGGKKHNRASKKAAERAASATGQAGELSSASLADQAAPVAPAGEASATSRVQRAEGQRDEEDKVEGKGQSSVHVDAPKRQPQQQEEPVAVGGDSDGRAGVAVAEVALPIDSKRTPPSYPTALFSPHQRSPAAAEEATVPAVVLGPGASVGRGENEADREVEELESRLAGKDEQEDAKNEHEVLPDRGELSRTVAEVVEPSASLSSSSTPSAHVTSLDSPIFPLPPKHAAPSVLEPPRLAKRAATAGSMRSPSLNYEVPASPARPLLSGANPTLDSAGTDDELDYGSDEVAYLEVEEEPEGETFRGFFACEEAVEEDQLERKEGAGRAGNAPEVPPLDKGKQKEEIVDKEIVEEEDQESEVRVEVGEEEEEDVMPKPTSSIKPTPLEPPLPSSSSALPSAPGYHQPFRSSPSSSHRRRRSDSDGHDADTEDETVRTSPSAGKKRSKRASPPPPPLRQDKPSAATALSMPSVSRPRRAMYGNEPSVDDSDDEFPFPPCGQGAGVEERVEYEAESGGGFSFLGSRKSSLSGGGSDYAEQLEGGEAGPADEGHDDSEEEEQLFGRSRFKHPPRIRSPSPSAPLASAPSASHHYLRRNSSFPFAPAQQKRTSLPPRSSSRSSHEPKDAEGVKAEDKDGRMQAPPDRVELG